jgi:hypothetical protein
VHIILTVNRFLETTYDRVEYLLKYQQTSYPLVTTAPSSIVHAPIAWELNHEWRRNMRRRLLSAESLFQKIPRKCAYACSINHPIYIYPTTSKHKLRIRSGGDSIESWSSMHWMKLIIYSRDTPLEPPKNPPALSSDGFDNKVGNLPAKIWK